MTSLLPDCPDLASRIVDCVWFLQTIDDPSIDGSLEEYYKTVKSFESVFPSFLKEFALQSASLCAMFCRKKQLSYINKEENNKCRMLLSIPCNGHNVDLFEFLNIPKRCNKAIRFFFRAKDGIRVF